MKYGIYIRPEVPVYLGNFTTEYNDKGQLVSAVSDEGLCGNCCRILNESEGWAEILSSYGYAGSVKTENLLICDEENVRSWLDGLAVTAASTTDVLTAPTVHGACLMSLPRGAAVKPLGEVQDGWAKVKLADGREGYVPEVYLKEKRYDEELLWADPEDLLDRQKRAGELRRTEIGGCARFDFKALLDKYYDGREELFREELVNTAKSYLGTQYRWAGRSSRGIDCSGMVGMSYLLSGIAVYRDASIVRDYPLKRLDLKWTDGHFDLKNLDDPEKDVLLQGDAIYFPGHVAMYLGGGMYIHSTGKAGSNGVVYNSLRPEHELFRQDLLDSMYAAAGIRL